MTVKDMIEFAIVDDEYDDENAIYLLQTESMETLWEGYLKEIPEKYHSWSVITSGRCFGFGQEENADPVIKLFVRIKDSSAEADLLALAALKKVANLSEEEICAMFDTGAFNSIAQGYALLALKQANAPKDIRNQTMLELHAILDETNASMAMKFWKGSGT